jgi:hypothetical protein
LTLSSLNSRRVSERGFKVVSSSWSKIAHLFEDMKKVCKFFELSPKKADCHCWRLGGIAYQQIPVVTATRCKGALGLMAKIFVFTPEFTGTMFVSLS